MIHISRRGNLKAQQAPQSPKHDTAVVAAPTATTTANGFSGADSDGGPAAGSESTVGSLPPCRPGAARCERRREGRGAVRARCSRRWHRYARTKHSCLRWEILDHLREPSRKAPCQT